MQQLQQASRQPLRCQCRTCRDYDGSWSKRRQRQSELAAQTTGRAVMRAAPVPPPTLRQRPDCTAQTKSRGAEQRQTDKNRRRTRTHRARRDRPANTDTQQRWGTVLMASVPFFFLPLLQRNIDIRPHANFRGFVWVQHAGNWTIERCIGMARQCTLQLQRMRLSNKDSLWRPARI